MPTKKPSKTRSVDVRRKGGTNWLTDRIKIDQMWITALGALKRCIKEPLKQRMLAIRTRLELWMRLGPDEERVIRSFDELHQPSVW